MDRLDRPELLVHLAVLASQELLDSLGNRDSKVRSVCRVSKVMLDSLEILDHRVYLGQLEALVLRDRKVPVEHPEELDTPEIQDLREVRVK